MKILCTSSRMPFAVDEIRKLGSAGHEVLAADTFRTSPGSHSHGVAERVIVPAPTQDPLAFVGEVADLLVNRQIDLLVPMFEEVFYLARHRDLLEPHAELFFATFDVLRRFHDKASFVELCDEVGVPVPHTITVTDDDQLRSALTEIPQYFARAAFSRGGVELLTNCGPLAGVIDVGAVHPTEANPWLVQPFVEGVDLCSCSIVQHGRVVAHCTYEHPKTIEHAGGIAFVSVVEPATLDYVARFAEATGYHGQISFDYLKHPDGTVSMVECNPRPTDGVALMSAEMFVEALLSPRSSPVVLEAGHRAQIDFALLRDMFREPKNIPSDFRDLFDAPDVYAGGQGETKHDFGPLLYEILSYSHVFAFRHQEHGHHHKHTDLMAAQFYDIEWGGSPIP
jgi:hypothetical protein